MRVFIPHNFGIENLCTDHLIILVWLQYQILSFIWTANELKCNVLLSPLAYFTFKISVVDPSSTRVCSYCSLVMWGPTTKVARWNGWHFVSAFIKILRSSLNKLSPCVFSYARFIFSACLTRRQLSTNWVWTNAIRNNNTSASLAEPLPWQPGFRLREDLHLSQ